MYAINSGSAAESQAAGPATHMDTKPSAPSKVNAIIERVTSSKTPAKNGTILLPIP